MHNSHKISSVTRSLSFPMYNVASYGRFEEERKRITKYWVSLLNYWKRHVVELERVIREGVLGV